MKKRLLYLILPLVTVILELLPYGAVCNFMNPEGDPWRETFSYFSLTPFGYANFAPFRNRKIFVCNTVATPYYEYIAIHPDYILADYVKMFHPQLLPDYSLVCYETMQDTLQ